VYIFEYGVDPSFLIKLEKTAPSLVDVVLPYLEGIKQVVTFAAALSPGILSRMTFVPLMLYQETCFKDGFYFEFYRGKKKSDILAWGGRLARAYSLADGLLTT
jgi:hypothetical protein